MTSGPNWYQIGKKSCYIPLVSKFSVEKRISGLTGLKVSLLARKCIFYLLEQNAKGGPHRTKF